MNDGVDLVAKLAETAGPAVAAIVVVLIILFAGLKFSGVGFAIGSRKALVDDKRFEGVATGVNEIKETLGKQLDKVEDRMTALEKDVEQRATRDEVHRLELAITRMEGRFESIDQRTSATAHGVTRIEEFMYQAALASKASSEK